MAQRISRAKQSIKGSGVRVPHAHRERARGSGCGAVLHVLYLIFNEGYASSTGPTCSASSSRARRSGWPGWCTSRSPTTERSAGLLALMLLTDARRHARTGPDGELIPLDEQDRSLWDRTAIAEGVALVTEALSRGAVGAYQLQAAIAAVHDEAARAADTDWPQILALYGLLKRMSDNPMVTLNHAVAAAMVHGPAAGLELSKPLDGDPRLAGHHRLDAVRAHLFEMAGDAPAAVAALPCRGGPYHQRPGAGVPDHSGRPDQGEGGPRGHRGLTARGLALPVRGHGAARQPPDRYYRAVEDGRLPPLPSTVDLPPVPVPGA